MKTGVPRAKTMHTMAIQARGQPLLGTDSDTGLVPWSKRPKAASAHQIPPRVRNWASLTPAYLSEVFEEGGYERITKRTSLQTMHEHLD